VIEIVNQIFEMEITHILSKGQSACLLLALANTVENNVKKYNDSDKRNVKSAKKFKKRALKLTSGSH